jgi:hypothetical protein
MSSIFTDGTTPLNKATLDQLEVAARKGAVNGYAGLDGGSKVPVAQLPVGSASGIAGLDAGSKVPVAQLPVAVANGIAGLDAGVKVPVAQLPAGVANGVASLDATGKVPAAQLPAAGADAGAQLDYAQITASPAAITVTTEATAAVLITGNAITYDGSAVYVEAFFPHVISSTNLLTLSFVFLRDANVLGYGRVGSAGTLEQAVFMKLRDTPAAGSHTYSLKAFVNSNNMTPQAGPGGSGNLAPAFLRVVKA